VRIRRLIKRRLIKNWLFGAAPPCPTASILKTSPPPVNGRPNRFALKRPKHKRFLGFAVSRTSLDVPIQPDAFDGWPLTRYNDIFQAKSLNCKLKFPKVVRFILEHVFLYPEWQNYCNQLVRFQTINCLTWIVQKIIIDPHYHFMRVQFLQYINSIFLICLTISINFYKVHFLQYINSIFLICLTISIIFYDQIYKIKKIDAREFWSVILPLYYTPHVFWYYSF